MLAMNKRNQLLCIWCAAIGGIITFVGYWPLAQFFPPLSPASSAEEIVAIYQDNTFGIRLGMILMQLGAAMFFPMVAVIGIQMRRIEGAHPVLAYTQILAGTINFLFLLLPPFFWTVAAFRPDRSPELTLLMNDIGWLCFIMPITPAIIQNFAIGVATLSDRRPKPVFPRWLAFFNFFIAILFIADLMITFFKSGPFAWNGAISFYMPLTVFTIWVIAMIRVLLNAIRAQED